ncbi:DUF4376 domain-containing protein [Thiofaba sp. EF100]|uniref:DUF4376 domain-containing protein n=1 Tax=Thiofaba sp. EF100 TaxID=3121274 RepID=UPI003221CBCD
MRIENHQLITDTTAIDLPRLSIPATVHVWTVPTEYRSDGLFIAVQRPGEPEEVPACDPAQCAKAMTETLPPHPDAVLAEAKAAKKRQIEADRDAQCEQPVSALGRAWDADKRSQELLATAVTLAQAGAPLPPVWRDCHNNDMPVTGIAELLAISGAIAAQTQAAYATSWMRKAAVDAATTLEEVEAA